MVTSNKSFLGSGWGFPPTFGSADGAVAVVHAEDDIRESLSVLISTVPGERIMNPTFGCRLKQMVFESIDESAVVEIRDVIERAILFFEPRISVNRIDVKEKDPLEGRVDVIIDYTVRSTNTRSNLVYPFYLNEASL